MRISRARSKLVIKSSMPPEKAHKRTTRWPVFSESDNRSLWAHFWMIYERDTLAVGLIVPQQHLELLLLVAGCRPLAASCWLLAARRVLIAANCLCLFSLSSLLCFLFPRSARTARAGHYWNKASFRRPESIQTDLEDREERKKEGHH